MLSIKVMLLELLRELGLLLLLLRLHVLRYRGCLWVKDARGTRTGFVLFGVLRGRRYLAHGVYAAL